MERITRFLFNFNRAYFYTFISGILVSLAANIFTTALLTGSLTISNWRAYVVVSFLSISSIGAFALSTLLEIVRSEWESAGSPHDPEVIMGFIENRKRLMWFSFATIFLGLIFSILFLVCN